MSARRAPAVALIGMTITAGQLDTTTDPKEDQSTTTDPCQDSEEKALAGEADAMGDLEDTRDITDRAKEDTADDKLFNK